jgi:hypothetical protein
MATKDILLPGSNVKVRYRETSSGSAVYVPDAPSSPAPNAAAVTPSDSTDLTNFARGLMVNVAGDVSVDFVDSGSSIILTLLAGVVYPFQVKRVRSTGTTATGITALF